MKLSKRLQQLSHMIAPTYQHIWDCCCDHGYLGYALLQDNRADVIHFVDVVPKLMTNLEAQLNEYLPSNGTTPNWQVHCQDVSQLSLSQYSGKQLIIIAGVGGDLVAQMVTDIVKRHPNNELHFLLCPVQHTYKLRATLSALKLGLLQEALVQENRRFYELLLVGTGVKRGIAAVGEDIWQPSQSISMQSIHSYHQQLIGHYQKVRLGNRSEVEPILAAYQGLILSGQER